LIALIIVVIKWKELKMKIKVGINGFGRIGRLALRAAYDWKDIEFVLINDVAGDAKTLAHLLEFDSIQGRWHHAVESADQQIVIGEHKIQCTQQSEIGAVDWSACDVVIEATGVNRDATLLQTYLDQGVKRVVVSAPVKATGIANIVVGVNDEIFQPELHKIVTAASCTTNCLAPVIKVINEKFGIEQVAFTTIHDLTNTQTILDAPHKDLRRARACGMSLIPTTTGSAKAIVEIFPELAGKIDGHAVRVPLANASLTDIVFNLKEDTSVEQVNSYLKAASQNELKGILGFEEKPLVSIDYRGDKRSTIVDALSTMMVGKRMLKIYAWYDNEMGYATRTAELMRTVALADK
jgi:glyceraldehyde 3-phosphate dehydrogenase